MLAHLCLFTWDIFISLRGNTSKIKPDPTKARQAGSLLIWTRYAFCRSFLKKVRPPLGESSHLTVPAHLHISSTCPTGMDASQMHLWNILYIVSETSQKGLICKSLRRLPGDWLKTSPQKHLWDLSGFLRDVFELHLRDCNSWPSN